MAAHLWVSARIGNGTGPLHLAAVDDAATLCGLKRPKKGWAGQWEGLTAMMSDRLDLQPCRRCEQILMGALD